MSQLQNPQALLNPQAAEAIRQQFATLGPQGVQVYEALLGAIRNGLVVALHDVFLLGAVLTALGLVTVLFLEEVPLRKSYGPAPAAAPEGAAEAAAQVGDAAAPSLPPLRPEDQPRPVPVAGPAASRRS